MDTPASPSCNPSLPDCPSSDVPTDEQIDLDSGSESDLPDSDDVVGVSSEQSLAVRRPGEGNALRWFGFAGRRQNFRLQLVHDDFAFQIPNLHGRTSGGAEPVSIGGEGEGVDVFSAFESVQVLSFVEIPQHGVAVFASGRAEGTVGRNRDRVQVTSVTDVIRLQLAIGQIPDLDEFVPAGGHDDGIRVGRGESDARNPVRMNLILNRVFADAQSVPQFDCTVARTRHDLSVVS